MAESMRREARLRDPARRHVGQHSHTGRAGSSESARALQLIRVGVSQPIIRICLSESARPSLFSESIIRVASSGSGNRGASSESAKPCRRAAVGAAPRPRGRVAASSSSGPGGPNRAAQPKTPERRLRNRISGSAGSRHRKRFVFRPGNGFNKQNRTGQAVTCLRRSRRSHDRHDRIDEARGAATRSGATPCRPAQPSTNLRRIAEAPHRFGVWQNR